MREDGNKDRPSISAFPQSQPSKSGKWQDSRAVAGKGRPYSLVITILCALGWFPRDVYIYREKLSFQTASNALLFTCLLDFAFSLARNVQLKRAG